MLSTILLVLLGCAAAVIIAQRLDLKDERRRANHLRLMYVSRCSLVTDLATENVEQALELGRRHDRIKFLEDELAEALAVNVLGAEPLHTGPRLVVVDNDTATPEEFPAWLETVFEMDQA